jgi:NADPH2:quinone reductase
LFGWLAQKKLSLNIYKVYPLAMAAEAHRDLEGRKTTGKLLLKP